MINLLKFFIVNLCLFLMGQVVNARTITKFYFKPVEGARHWQKVSDVLEEEVVRKNISIISKKDLLKTISNVPEEEQDKVYNSYIQNELDFQLSASIFERILDYESTKLKIKKDIPLEYTDFALKYILQNNAVNLNLLDARTADTTSFKELYQYLLDLVKSAEEERGEKLEKIDFIIDWQDRSVNGYSNHLFYSSRNTISLRDFPKVKLSFHREEGKEILPDDFIKFDIKLREKLELLYRKIVREYTWNALLNIEYSDMVKFASEVDIGEHYRMYDKYKEEQFFYYENIAVFEKIEFEGKQHKEAMDLYLKTLKKKLSIELKELKKNFDKDEEGRIVESQQNDYVKKKKELETRLPKEVFASIKDKLIALDQQEKISDVNISEEDIKSNKYSDVEKEKLAKFFNMQSLMSFFPHTKLESSNKSELYFLRDLTSSDEKKYYEAYDKNVRNKIEHYVRSKAFLNLYGSLFRKVINRTPIEYIGEICEQGICSTLNWNNYYEIMPKLLFGRSFGSMRLTDFEEKLFENKSLDDINIRKFLMFKDIFRIDLTKKL